MLILGVSIVYTTLLAQQLKQQEEAYVNIFAQSQEFLQKLPPPSENDNLDMGLILTIQSANTTTPMLLVNERGGIDFARNFGPERDQNPEFLQKELEKLKAQGAEPIAVGEEGYRQYIYFKRSRTLLWLSYFPLVQIILILGFLLLGYVGLANARRAEQNRLWVGMAKETAHQLGTPISAIIAWIEYLKELHPEDEATSEVVRELDKDAKRLELIADRFSKIGAEPQLQSEDLYELLERTRAYMQARSPRKVEYDFPGIQRGPLTIMVNPQLFNWVLENLVRNALDSMEGIGCISASVYTDDTYVCLDLSDTGKGIPSSRFKAIFRPGYSTKKRGWGLGLSLAKRIIEVYHKGRIFVKSSTLGEGSTFTVKIPQPKGKDTGHR